MDEINLPKVSKFSKFFTLFFGLLLLILGIWFFSLPDESPCLMISFLKGIYAELFGLGLGVLIFQLLLKWLERRMAIKKESYKMSKSEDEAKAMKGLSNLRNGGWLSDGSLVGLDILY